MGGVVSVRNTVVSVRNTTTRTYVIKTRYIGATLIDGDFKRTVVPGKEERINTAKLLDEYVAEREHQLVCLMSDNQVIVVEWDLDRFILHEGNILILEENNGELKHRFVPNENN